MSQVKNPLSFEFGLYYRASARHIGQFKIAGRAYRFGPHGQWLLWYFIALVQKSRTARDPRWLIRYRPLIRRIEYLDLTALLTYIIGNSRFSKSQRMAIWLRGRCKGTFGTKTVAKYLESPNVKIRKEVVRALQRMHGWSELRYLAENDPHPRIRCMARQREIEKFDSRSRRFFDRSVQARKFKFRAVDLFVDDNVDFGLGLPPKPASLIRTILDRIRLVVSGRGKVAQLP